MSSDPDSLITAGASDWTGNTSAVKKNYLKNHKTEKDKSEATGVQDEPRQTVMLSLHPGIYPNTPRSGPQGQMQCDWSHPVFNDFSEIQRDGWHRREC